MPPKKTSPKDEDPIVFEDLHPGDSVEAGDEDEDDVDPYASFQEAEDPFAMPDGDDEPSPETRKRPAIEAVEDEESGDDDLVGQEDEPGDEDEVEEEPPDGDEDEDELSGVKDPALRRRILADRRRLDEQDHQIQELSTLTVEQTKSNLKFHEKEVVGRIDTIKDAIVKAKEDGETKVEVDKQAELQEALIEKSRLEDRKKQIEAAGPPGGQPAGRQKMTPRSEEAKRYLEKNPWIEDNRFQEERDAMGIIDRGLFAEKYDINSPDYFKELDRRLRAKFPNLPGGRKAMKKSQKQPQKKRSSVAGVDRGGVPRGRSRSGKVVLDAEDRANMRRFGLDDTDPDTVRQYAAEKRKIDEQEEQRQA